MLRRMLLIAGLVGTALLIASPAMASYPPDSPTVGAGSSNVAGGASTTLTGAGWQPGSTVTFALEGKTLGTATVAGDGTFSASVSVPCVSAGSHTITASGTGSSGSAQSVTTSVTVTACATTTGTLPHTGSETSALLTIMSVSLLVGAVLVIAATRRRAAKVTNPS